MRDCQSEADIRTAAYFLWQARGHVHGQDELDWYAAQRILERRILDAPPSFKSVDASLVQRNIALSHCGHDELFSPSSQWVELAAHPRAMFDCDANRRLHFDEGFLCACHRIFNDLSITFIEPSDHFPYRDLAHFRRTTHDVMAAYRAGASMPPPIFFYPAPYQLEILDGVHRCLAAYELARSNQPGRFSPAGYRIWLGFDRERFDAHHIAHQLWVISLFHAGGTGSTHAHDHT